jgi:prevent-host-death family protein
MRQVVGAFEAKTKLPELLRRVQAGERFIITSRGAPVAELGPVAAPQREAVASMRRFKRVRGISAATVRSLINEGRR